MNIKSKLRVSLVDDHVFFTDCFQVYLKKFPDLELLGAYSEGESFLNTVSKQLPDLVFMDIGLPGLDGLEITRRLGASYPEIKVVIVSMNDDLYTAQKAFQAGAFGFLSKSKPSEEIIKVLQCVKENKRYIGEFMTEKFINAATSQDPVPKESYSKREFEVLNLLANDKTDKEIANVLGLSKRTIEEDKKHIGRKMGVSKSAAMVAKAFKMGMLR